MVVQHNMQAINSNRMLGITEKTVAGSTEKLSSGYAINRAADNAAGLAISEKMRKQIRGLTQASINAEDGISSVQTAEGALAEVQDMLQRMNELCVQAANGTNSSTDRQYIQDEIDQLVEEVDRVAETTKFNETYLLKGDKTAQTTKSYVIDYSVADTPNPISNSEENKNALATKVNYTGSNNVFMVESKILTSDSSEALTAKKISKGEDITDYLQKNTGKTLVYSDATQTTSVSVSSAFNNGVYQGGLYSQDGILLTSSDFSAKAYNAEGNEVSDISTYFDASGSYLGGLYNKNGDKLVADDFYTKVYDSTGTETGTIGHFPGGVYDNGLFDKNGNKLDASAFTINSASMTATWSENVNGNAVIATVSSPAFGYFAVKVDSTGHAISSATISASNYKEYFELTNTGTIALRAGYDLYKVKAEPGTNLGTQLEAQRVSPGELTTYINANMVARAPLYSDAACTTAVTLGQLTSYFDEDGTRKAGTQLWAYNGGTKTEVGQDYIEEIVKVTPASDAYLNPTVKEYVLDGEHGADNKVGATINDNYVAFVTIELNSNLAIGNNGSVASQVNQASPLYDADKDLSTDGTDDTVKANKDLYIYNRATQTVTHIKAGESMTPYLNEDRTMNSEKYTLVDILYSQKGLADDASRKTSARVSGQLLGDVNTDFVWNNNYLKADISRHQLYNADGEEVTGMGLYKYFDKNGKYTGGLYTTAQARTIDQVFPSSASDTDEYKQLEKYFKDQGLGQKVAEIEDYITVSSTEVLGDLDFKLHVGADGNKQNKIDVVIESLTAAGLGVDKLSSDNIGIVDSTGKLATDAIDVVAAAIDQISRQRAALGAAQNRLEHTIKNLDNVVENTQAAESTIRDTDMATEMVKYSNANILQQAGQSMLAQSNQANQGVMSLLQ